MTCIRRALILFIMMVVGSGCLAATPAPPPPPTAEQPVPGGDLLAEVHQRGILRVGLSLWPEASFAPPAFRGASNAMTGGAMTGFEVELAYMLAEVLGYELELIEANPAVLAGDSWPDTWDVALASLVPFDSRDGVLFSNPYGYMPVGFLVAADNAAIQSPADVTGRRVGALENSPYHTLLTTPQTTIQGQPVIAAWPADIQPIAVSNLPKAIRELTPTSEVEVLFGPTPIFEVAAREGMPVQFVPDGHQIGVVPLAIAAHNPDTAQRLIERINEALDIFHRRGILAELYIQWYRRDLSRLPD